MSLVEPKSFIKDNLTIEVFPDRDSLGIKAAERVAENIREKLLVKPELRIVFAAAPSQNEFLKALVVIKNIEWERISAFHMDEYIGLEPGAEQLFSNYLKKRIFDLVPFKKVNLINSTNNPEEECKRYESLLVEAPIDIICMGVGENGHIAFNDPPVADFNDPVLVKVVELDDECRIQQVNDGCFPSFNSVPKKAITLTIPALMSGEYLSVVVPGIRKTPAVNQMLEGDISTDCPASILRKHKNAILYLDKNSVL